MNHRWKISRLAVIAPLYYLCKLFGVMPVSYSYSQMENNRSPKNFCGRFHNNVQYVRFYVSKSGFMFWSLQFALQAWTFFGVSKIIIKSIASKKKINCSIDHYCSTLGILISHSLISAIVIVLVQFRLKKTACCLNMTATLLLRNRFTRKLPMATFAILLFIITFAAKAISLAIMSNIHYPLIYYTFVLVYMCPILLIHLICILCLVSQNSYEDINRELEELCSLTSKSERALRLRSLMNDHWFLENYTEYMSNTFGLELLFIILDIYIQLVLFMYIYIWTNIVHRKYSGLFTCIYATLQIAITAVNLFYVCYRCNATVKESRRVIFQLQHLRDKLYNDPICQTILKIFTIRVNCRKVHISASNLVNINLSLIVGSAGVVLAYFLVLIQFQMAGYKNTSSKTNISAIVFSKCKLWPCIISGE